MARRPPPPYLSPTVLLLSLAYHSLPSRVPRASPIAHIPAQAAVLNELKVPGVQVWQTVSLDAVHAIDIADPAAQVRQAVR